MRITKTLLLLVFSGAAFADPVRTDPSPDVTVFTDADGAHVVTLLEGGGGPMFTIAMSRLINPKENGRVRQRKIANAVFSLGHQTYWVRTRFIDGELVCEKFAERPKDPEQVAARAAELFKESCS